MPVPYFPPEITDAVIMAVGNVRKEDRQTLLACCLVCRAWLPASRTHLFGYIAITRNWHRYTLLVDSVLHSDTMSRYLASIHTLHFGAFTEKSDRSGGFNLQFLIEFSGRLPGLRTLTLLFVRLDEDVTYRRWPLLFSRFPTITSLALHYGRFYSPTDLRRMLAALQSLEQLTLLGPAWRSSEAQQQHLCSSLRARWPALHYLHLRLMHISQSTEMLVRWIALSLVGSPLETLEFYHDGEAPDSLQEAAATLFGSVGGYVKDLTIGMHPQVTNVSACPLPPTIAD